MTLQRLAREIDETARQTGAMVEAVSEALVLLTDPGIPAEAARKDAAAIIVSALQGQDRIEQRCRDLARAVRRFAALPPSAPQSAYDEIWESLVLDELRVASLSGVAARVNSGEVELF